MVLLLASMALASNETASELKARADAAHGGEQAKLCLEYARHQLDDANALFTDGQVDKAQSEVREVVDYARKGGRGGHIFRQAIEGNRNQAAQTGRTHA